MGMNEMDERGNLDDLSIPLNNPLFAAQVALEEEMRTAGIERFEKAVKEATKNNDMTSTKAGSRLLTEAHEKFAKGIVEWMEEARTKAGRRHSSIKYLEKLPVDVTATLAARSIVDGIMVVSNITKIANAIGTQLEHEVNSRLFEEAMPKAHEKFLDKANKQNREEYKWNHLLMPAKLMGADQEEWDKAERITVGKLLIDIFIDSTGLVSLDTVHSGHNTQINVVPNAATVAWIEKEHDRLKHLFPIFMPTIIPPKKWEGVFGGGYYTNHVRQLRLIKTHNKAYLSELAERDMPEVYGAVNAIQETAWAINHGVLEVVKTFMRSSGGIAELPPADDLPIPNPLPWFPTDGSRLTAEEMTEEQAAEFKEWKARVHGIKYQNAVNKVRRVGVFRLLSVADKFAQHEEFYYPHQLDWRSRIYPVPLYLHPQGSDLQRGLLTFAATVPILDRDAANWLGIHGAGMFGYDKVSLDDRVAWIEAHEALILASAENPYDCRWWLDADKPWQFLAFCLDWAGFKREGYGYESSLPVQLDGTCNGLQNFSAMLLDEVGGKAVNLIDAPLPNDIYGQVAGIVNEAITADLSSLEEVKTKWFDENQEEHETVICAVRDLAKGWLGYVDRKVTKRPVMTLSYGAKRFGFVTQIDEDTVKPWRDKKDGTFPFVGEKDGKPLDYGYQASMYMAKHTWDAASQVVVAAFAAMEWLQEVAKEVSKAEAPINWTTPTGLLVQQSYRKYEMKRIKTTFKETVIRLSVVVGEGQINSRKQATGISPNWVHSLDASHLMKTVNACHALGIRSFSMIHDSYGTHAGNIGTMAVVLREEFVRMYSQVDVLAKFKEDIETQLGITLPPLPPKGNLDLNEVLNSTYFFS